MDLIEQIKKPLQEKAGERAREYSDFAQACAEHGDWDLARRSVDMALELWWFCHAA